MESDPKYFEHVDTQKQLSERTNKPVTVGNEAYPKRMDERPSNQRGLKSNRDLHIALIHPTPACIVKLTGGGLGLVLCSG